ncbi:MAG: hypothetical protein ACOC1X_02655 [Promethearchaeota archaeon]
MKSLLERRKGQMGIGVAKMFVVGLLSLVIIGVTMMVVLNSLGDATETEDSYTVNNETGAYINSTEYTVENADADGFTNFQVDEARNASDGTVIDDSEYDVDSDAGTISSDTATYDDVELDYTYDADNEIANTLESSSNGLKDFFTNTGTWLALLAVVIIILIISAVVIVVNRFGVREEEQEGEGLQL